MSTENLDLTNVDRGDVVEGEVVEKEVVDDKPETKDAEVELPADEVEGEKEGEDKGADKGAVRDDKGRFAKKDEDDEPRIPKSRFDQQIARERSQREAAERRSQELEAKLAESKVTEDVEAARAQLKSMIKQRNDFLADGKLDEASEVDEKIFDFQNAVATKQAKIQAMSAKEAAKEEMRYDAIVATLESQHPELNPDDDAYDELAVEDVQAVMAGLQQTKGMSPSQALAKAVKMVLGEPAKAEPTKTDKSAEAGEKRKADAVARNTTVAGKQPPKTTAVGIDHDKVGGGLETNLAKLNYDEFAKLGEDALAKMRGDFI